ncbi:MAG: CoA transferase, partial [Actinobacteria bacterium]|nr:CoA transferase [Actinomycetota bacterium]
MSLPISAGETSSSSPGFTLAATAARKAFARSRLSWFTVLSWQVRAAGASRSPGRRDDLEDPGAGGSDAVTEPEDRGPLEGVRVIDFSRVLAGPLCTMILGDLGADVVKVERPGEGDDTRHWGPPFVGEDAAYFLSLNRNKRSVALDLSTSEGAQAARRLVLSGDVVIENFRPGLMVRFGLDYEALAAEKPGLVYCSLTAFGDGGESESRPGYDIIVQGLSGLM